VNRAAAPKRVLRYRRRLRSRIIISFLLLGFGLTTLFAVSTLLLRNQLENQLVENWLATEAKNFVQFKREHPEPEARYGFTEQQIVMGAYRPSSPNIPFEWRDLPSGIYNMRDQDALGHEGNYKLVVERQPDIVGFIKYYYGRQSLAMQQLVVLLGGSVVLFSLLALLLGLWASRRVMSPVADLAARLRAFGRGATPEPLAPHFANDEVGQLAAAFDEYSDRLTALVRRDREFNADVSHELRTPLAVIRGATELLLTQPDLPPKAQIRLKRIERAVQQCSDLIEALLTLSRSERGHGAADLKRVVEQLVETERLAIRGKPVELVIEGGEGIVVDAPEAVLSVALGNLIGNAVKYTQQGEVRIRLLPDRVEILDSGPGIDAEEAGRLFQRGYRGKSSEGSRGAGIGLAIVTRLCELYGWQASLAPRPEGGAIATLRFGGNRR